MASKDDKADEAIMQQIMAFRDRGRKLGLTDEEIYEHFDTSPTSKLLRKFSPSLYMKKTHIKSIWRRRKSQKPFSLLTSPVVCAVVAIGLGLGFGVHDYISNLIYKSECLVNNNPIFSEMFRPLFPCNMCKNLTKVPEVTNISAEEFARLYAYTGVPVLIKGGISNWSAMHSFSFQYFKKVYTDHEGALETVRQDCQFFPYNTQFYSLEEAFNMSDDRAAFKEGEENWYIGWSNCDSDVGNELRTQYSRPDFLPNDSENIQTDWIFMGGPGHGAGMHIDSVERPSWQAQVSGTKTWKLLASPECESICHHLNVTVEKGDIFVADTNIWYHSTYIHPGEISITIGSEFD